MKPIGWVALAVGAMILYLIIDHFRKRKTGKEVILQEEPLRPLDEAEIARGKSIRRQWLITFCIYMLLTIVGAYLISVVISQQAIEEGKLHPDSSPMLLGLIPLFVFILPFGWAIYHFSYRKSGTAWLTVLIILLIIGLISSFGSLVGINPEVAPEDWLLLKVLEVINFAFFTYFLVTCYRLRRFNLELKKR